MDSIKLLGQKPKMIAHRGLSGVECENTCPAFVLAGSRSYFGIETDLHISKDGKYVICHDANLSRVANGVEIVIEENDYERVRAVPLLDAHMGSTRSDLFVPLLSDYIAICKKYGKRAILEMKTDFSSAEVDGMLAEIAAQDYLNSVTFISFYKNPLVLLKEKNPNFVCQFLTGDATEETLAFLDKYGIDLDIGYWALTKEYVDLVHAHGHEVNCWTIDVSDVAEKVIDMGVDYITSNILE